MKRTKSHILLPLVTAAIMLFLSACGGSGGTNNASGGSSPETSPSAAAASGSSEPASSSEPIKVVWWHSMGGELGQVATQLVQEYNASQSKVQVEEVYQGSYDESLNKMKASMDSKSGPSLIQVYEIGSRYMIDSGSITPVQEFIDAEGYDMSQIEPNIAGYYTFDGKQYSMPFNTSNPILYYNKTLFKEAGLDPEKPPATYDELKEAALAINKTGKTGASFAIYGWFMEQFFANQGKDYLNNGNGRNDIATESLVNSEAGIKTLTWWKDLVDSKAAINLGRKTDDTKKAFLAGQIGMTLDSTASLRGIVDGAGSSFEVGTGFLPKANASDKGGVIIGGASLWVLNNKSKEEQQAAWDFIKFLAKPETQAFWHINTGYFPITTKAYEDQRVVDNMTKYPQFSTAVDQLHATELTTATQGAVMGVFPEARQLVEDAIEQSLGGKDPAEALDSAAKSITEKIETYNKTVK